MDRLNWSKLKTFYRVASCGSFARAAEKYHISSTALSKMIKGLEQDLNCQLFTRNDNGVELTHKGELLYRDAVRITNMLEFTEERILENHKKIKKHIKLVAPTGQSSMYISCFIDSFINNNPEIYLEIVSYDEMSLNEKLTGHMLIHPFIEGLNGYKQESLITMELKLFASQEYLLKFGTPLIVDELDSHRIIGFSRGKKLPIDLNWHLKLGMPVGKERTPIFEADANFGRCYLAYKGVGIISVPKQHPDVKKYELVEVLPEIKGPKYTYYLIIEESLCGNTNIEVLADFLKQKFSEL
jgi:DNA-binding transcriptional LysR family regulator